MRVYGSMEVGGDPIGFSALQDRDGILYVGGRTAVLRFDGEAWSSLPVPDTIVVRALDFAPDGRLWVGGFGNLGWFEWTQDGQARFHSLRAQLPAEGGTLGQLWEVFAEGTGGALFFAEDRILRWDGRAFAVWPMPGARRLPAMRLGGAVHFHHAPTGLYRFDPAGPTLVIPARLLGDVGVLWIEDRGSHWLLATSKGLVRWQDGKLTPYAPEVSAYLTKHMVTKGVRLPDGRYAFGTFEGGIALMTADGRLDGVLTEEQGLPARIVRSLYLDRSDQLWVMSTSSITRIDLLTPTRFFDQRAGLPPQPYHDMTLQGDRLVVAGERGIFALREDDTTFAPLQAGAEVAHAVRGTADGLLLSLTRQLVRLTESGPVLLHRSTSDILGFVPPARPGDDFQLFIGRTLQTRTAAGDLRVVVDELPDFGRHVVRDAEGDLWLELLTRGVYHARPAATGAVHAARPPARYGLPSDLSRALVRGRGDGTVLVAGTNGAWIRRPHEARFAAVAGWPTRPVAAATEFTADETIWTVHPATERLAAVVGCIRFDGARAWWEPRDVPGLAEIGPPRSALATRAPEAALWIGGARSVLRLPLAAAAPVRPPAPPLLHAAARRDDGTAPAPIAGPLPFDTREIVFTFAAPHFGVRDALRLETRIEGVDTGWVPAGAEARRSLTAMREGSYRFAVRAVAASGTAGPPAEFAFQVLPPWWHSPPALLAAFAALLPLGYGAYRLRVRQLRRRTEELEARVRQRTEELEAANRAKTEFVANMSHDIRNPLNGIVGLTLALEDSRLDPRQREIVATLRDCTTYLSSLVDDVLDFASIEAGRIEVRPVTYAPAELLRSIVATLRNDAAQSGATITTAVDPALPPHLQGDAGRIQQILVNFVSNALKYAGGPIELAVNRPADAADEVEFSVRDHGPGIPRDEQAVLFTKFTRLRQRHGGDPIPGTGLGLAACRLLADALGGAVGVASEPGQGARFFLRLPAVAAAAPRGAAPELPADAPVLLVEDTDYNAWAASAVLARMGLACERAATGAEALRMFAAKRFKLVLLDRNLPDMDGTEVARRLRELEAGDNRAVLLAVTAYCTAQDRELCLQAGMDAFVGKPLTPEKLRRVLAETGRRLVATPSVHLAGEPPPAGPDLSLIAYLAGDRPDALSDQLRRYVAELDDVLARLDATAAAGDLAALAELAHRLLGHSRLVNDPGLTGAATRLEASARAGDAAACATWQTCAHAEAARLRAAILQRGPTAPTG